MDSVFVLVSSMFGGLGLFLLGMGMMTDGLKLAGGYALQHMLAKGTSTPPRALIAGFSVTALVQSSTAVTVAVIGFVNAGLLEFARSVWVIFGSNVGTTITAWIVAIIGFKVKIDIFALPAIAIGVMFYVFSRSVRPKSLGGALTGLGLLFLGLQLMQQAFSGVETYLDFSWMRADSLLHLLMMVFIGIALTAVMQSSSASLAVVLTAVSTGVLPISAGAAAVIGANVGTTITAILAVLKASSNARRLASAHVIFNVVAAVIAFLLMGPVLALVEWLREVLGLEAAPAVSLALFHTIFNILGVLVMIPFTQKMTRYLEQRFLSQEEQVSRPRYLDRVTAEVPDMAVKALNKEQRRLIRKLGELLKETCEAVPGESTTENRFVVAQLISAINDFIVESSRRELAPSVAETLQQAIRVNSRGATVVESLRELQKIDVSVSEMPDDVAACVIKLRDQISQLSLISEQLDTLDAKAITAQLHTFQQHYEHCQEVLIRAGRGGAINIRKMEQTTVYLSLLRRATRQYIKALLSLLRQDGSLDEQESTAA